jgi:hypothetical protein
MADLTPEKRPGTHLTGGYVNHRTCVEKFTHTGIRSLDRPFRGQSLYRLSYHGLYIYIYRVSREECIILRERVPYVKIYRYSPKHLYPKLNGYGDNGQRKVWSTSGFHILYLPADSVSMPVLQCGIILHITLSL